MTSETYIDSSAATVGTAAAAAAAKVWLATLALSIPAAVCTVSESFTTPSRINPTPRITSRASFLTGAAPSVGGTVASWPDSLAGVEGNNQGERATTDQERLIGEIRRWALVGADWDGEGAASPTASSLDESVAFVRLLDNTIELPEPMLLSSGHAGLFWKADGLYADLEFLGDGRIAYFIEHEGVGKHKGVVKFDSEKMPAVFSALLRS